MSKTVTLYSSKNCKTPYLDWIDSIRNKFTKKRIEQRIVRLKLSHYGDYKPIKNGLYELRLMFGPGYRIYFAEVDDTVVLFLVGGDKSTQAKDVELAPKYWKNFKDRYETEKN